MRRVKMGLVMLFMLMNLDFMTISEMNGVGDQGAKSLSVRGKANPLKNLI